MDGGDYRFKHFLVKIAVKNFKKVGALKTVISYRNDCFAIGRGIFAYQTYFFIWVNAPFSKRLTCA